MKLLAWILPFLILTSAYALQVDVNERLRLYKVYRQQSKKFNSHKTTKLKRAIVNQAASLNQDLLKRLDQLIPSPFVDSIVYHTLLDKDSEKLEEALVFLMLNRFLLVKHTLQSPNSSAELKERSLALLSKWSSLENWDETSTNFMLELIQRRGSLISQIGSVQAIVEAIEGTSIVSDRLDVELGLKNALLAEPIGSIPGNIVSVFFKNDRSLSRANQLREVGKLKVDDPLRTEMAKQLAQDSLVKPLFEMITNSKENLIMVSSETSGVSEDTIISALKKKLDDTTDWKVVYIGIGSTSPRVLSLASEYRSRFAIMAIPDEHKQDNTLSWQTFIPVPDLHAGSQHGLGLLAIIDSASTTPQSFITSRRFADHPHAYSFEQSITLQGPASGLLPQLLHENLKQLVPSYTDLSNYFPYRTHYPEHGQESVLLTVDSARLGARDDRALAVKFLIETKERVLLDQYMLYDRAIVDTLIKLKIKNPDLVVLVLIDTNLDFGMNGLPNAIFIKEMKQYGIEIKARRSLNWQESSEDNSISQLYALNHRNLIIRDDKDIFIGTGPFTGSFEKRSPISFGVQFSSAMSAEVANSFMRDWDNADATYELDIENYEAKLGEQRLSRRVSSFLNNVFSLLLRAFD